MKRILAKLESFMARRYGTDDLNRFLMRCVIVLLLLGILIGWTLFKALALVLFCYMTFRMMSRNIWNRQKENYKFREWMKPFNSRCDLIEKNMKDKEYRYYRCPHCKQTVRVPKGKGKIEITCPRCGKHFDKKS